MAYTTTTLSGNVTLTGTSGADSITSAAAKKIQVNSYEGLDNLTLSGSASSGTIGMGGSVDTVTITTGQVSKLNISLGDGADTFTSGQTDSKITVGGQGGADKFVISAAATDSYYGGGQGKDTYYATSSDGGHLGAKSTIVGGSENDTIGISTDGVDVDAAAFINGQVGEDKIYVVAGATATVRGGSEADTIKVTSGSSGQWMYGDNDDETKSDNGCAVTLKMKLKATMDASAKAEAGRGASVRSLLRQVRCPRGGPPRAGGVNPPAGCTTRQFAQG